MKLKNSERTRCEVWSRVMGYHRPVTSWNIGKQQEFEDRVMFNEKLGTGGFCGVVDRVANHNDEQYSGLFKLRGYNRFSME